MHTTDNACAQKIQFVAGRRRMVTDCDNYGDACDPVAGRSKMRRDLRLSIFSIQPLQYACRSRGNGGQGTAVVIRRDAKSLLTLDLHCNIISLDMTLHSCKSSHNVLHLHVLCHAIVCTVYCMCTCVFKKKTSPFYLYPWVRIRGDVFLSDPGM